MAPFLLVPLSAALAATSAWDVDVRSRLRDPIGLEVALERRGVAPRNASLVFGVLRRAEGPPSQAVQLNEVGWSRMHGAALVDPGGTAALPGEPGCGVLAGHDPIVSERELVLTRPLEPGDAEPLAMALATGAERDLAIASLMPGDSLQIVSAEHRRTGQRVERVEIRRGDELLSLTRDGRRAQVCYQRP